MPATCYYRIQHTCKLLPCLTGTGRWQHDSFRWVPGVTTTGNQARSCISLFPILSSRPCNVLQAIWPKSACLSGQCTPFGTCNSLGSSAMSMAPASSSDLRSTSPNAIASNIVDSGNPTHNQISSQAANPAARMPLFPKTITALTPCTIVYLKIMLCRIAQCTAFQQHWRSMHPCSVLPGRFLDSAHPTTPMLSYHYRIVLFHCFAHFFPRAPLFSFLSPEGGMQPPHHRKQKMNGHHHHPLYTP